MSERKPRIALWFRYGPADHTELFHAMPAIVERLAGVFEVHYFGLRTASEIPAVIRSSAVIHALPFTVDRASSRDKVLKSLLWILCLPLIALRCRVMRVRAVYIDENIPLAAPIARVFYGKRVVVTVADFFGDIYLSPNPLLRPVAAMIKALDFMVWRRLPLIFTRAKSTISYLEENGVPVDRIRAVYDPCDSSVYHPLDKTEPRKAMGLHKNHVVLVHHGILHPNKGNDRIIRALAPLREQYPHLRYLLVGDGPELAALKHLTAELGLEEMVLFTGWLSTLEEVNRALNAGDIGLVMRTGSRMDDFHMTGALVHSMACGLPVLAARLGGVTEVVREGISGLLFDPDNMDEFRKKLVMLIEDEQLRYQLGEESLSLSARLFDMEHVTRATVEALTQVAGNAN
ncbi:MAG: glycosyltransferase family 4 protein [Verrucomicrobia bacterium]|nr:glycosyltransferase family 4 protein [Verrucomicrobiota bacterium]